MREFEKVMDRASPALAATHAMAWVAIIHYGSGMWA